MAIIQDREMQRKSMPMLQPSCKKQHQTFYIKKKRKKGYKCEDWNIVLV